jgi:hypothetical protein
MSKAKLAAAKELIQEKRYAEARALLKTVNNPTAARWLERLDHIAPQSVTPPAHDGANMSPATAEAERYFQAENRKRRRRALGRGIEVIILGLGLAAIGVYLASLPKFTIPGAPPPDDTLSIVLLAGGLLFTLVGVYVIRRGNE